MEAVRHVEARSVTTETQASLPPPPAPFPVGLLGPRTLAAPQTSASTDASQTEKLRPNLEAIQQCCIAALSGLIPYESTSTAVLAPHDQQLAAALTDLLEATYDLEQLCSVTPKPPGSELDTSTLDDSFDALGRVLEQVSAREAPSENGRASDIHPAINVVREELAWNRIDALGSAVQDLARGRPARREAVQVQEDPPRYSSDDRDSRSVAEGPPAYIRDAAARSTLDDNKGQVEEAVDVSSSAVQEKMMSELDAMAAAIERLHRISPRLHNQRHAQDSTTNRDRVGINGDAASIASPKSEQAKMKELEEIWDMIERAHRGRRALEGQRSGMDSVAASRRRRRAEFLHELYDKADVGRMEDQNGMPSTGVNVELAKARDLRDRDDYLQALVEQSDASRLEGQDAEMQDNAERHRSYIADIIERSRRSRLPGQDFPESVQDRMNDRQDAFLEGIVQYSSSGRLTNQDSSAPSELKQARTMDPMEEISMRDFLGIQEGQAGRPRSSASAVTGPTQERQSAAADFSYIAEHQENIRSVQVLLSGLDTFGEQDLVLETGSDVTAEARIRSKDTQITMVIPMPAEVLPDQTIPLSRSEEIYIEARLASLPRPPATPSLSAVVHALSASEIRQYKPAALQCVSCGQQVADIRAASESTEGYKDLPSEHWAEMMEVWMCHNDPSWTAKLAKRTEEGFWPTKGRVLVGGSYLLVAPDNVRSEGLVFGHITDNASWRSVTCVCGQDLGKSRCAQGQAGHGALRLTKWSVALAGAGQDSKAPLFYPLPEFILSDILELAQAHASYRFILSDEATNERRLLLWLFKPSVQISYRSGSQSQSGSAAGFDSLASTGKTIHASKIMYKVATPDEDLSQLPGFQATSQVEHLSYPATVCDQFITALRESSSLYPPERRSLGVFKVGFVRRA